MTKHAKFHWNELMTWDSAKAKAFYGDALGWTFDEMPMPQGGDYIVAMSDGEPAGGIFTLTPGPLFEGVAEHWLPYIAVDDIDARCEKAKASGGTIHREPWDVPGVGRIAIIQDPNGALIGWVTPADGTS